MDLALKGTVMKPVESGRPNPNTQLSQIRGIATAVGHTQTRLLNSGIQTISSVPLSTGTSGNQTLKQVSGPRAGIAVAPTSSSTITLTQGSAVVSTRPTLSVHTTSSHISTTYHVPRGAAAVANIAAPRSAVATPIVRATAGATSTTHGTSFVSGLRGLGPSTLAPRTPSPATSGTTWLSSSAAQASSPVVMPKCVSPRPRAPSINTLPGYAQGRPTSMTVTARPITPQVGRLQTEPTRPQLLHASAQKTITGTQLHIAESNYFKPGVSVQSALGGVSIAQVLPARTQAPLTYSNPATVAAATHFSTPCSQGTATLIATQPHQLALSQGTARLAVSSQGAVLAAAPAPQRSAAAVLSSPARVSTAATGFATPGRLTTTTLAGQARIATAGQGTAALARLNVAASTPAGTAVTQARLAVATNTAGSAVLAGQTRLTMSASTTVPSSVPARLTVSTGTGVSSGQTHQGTTVLATQTRLAVPNTALASTGVVSLHPVVVSNATTGLPLKPAGARTITTHQTLGPKVIAQPVHGPSIQITQVPVSAVSSVAGKLSQAALTISTGTARTVTYTATTTVSGTTVSGLRPVTVGTSPAIPVAKVFPQATPVSEVTLQSQPQTQATSVYIQTSHRASPAPTSNQVAVERTGSMMPTYSLPTAYYYEPPTSGYQVASVARPYAPASPYTVQTTVAAPVPALRPGLGTHQVHGTLATPEAPAPSQIGQQPLVSKPNASPRPSILRKRDNEGSPLKAAKNLTPVLASLGAPVSPPSPRRPDSRGNGGNSSGGSTTISATSSPGLGEGGEDSLPPIKQELPEESEKPPVEMSPRKKPRKQQLTGNELHEPKFSEDEMEFISEEKIKKEIKEAPEESEEKVFIPKRSNMSLINSYRHTWKSRHNHYLRYTDVKPKDERRPTVTDLANQKQVLQKLNGWKIYHLSTQMEDLSDLESQVFEKLTATLKVMERKTGKDLDKDVNRVNELIKGNIQRSKVIKDQMQEAKCQVMKIFDHKGHVTDIISRCANKRSMKKREKS